MGVKMTFGPVAEKMYLLPIGWSDTFPWFEPGFAPWIAIKKGDMALGIIADEEDFPNCPAVLDTVVYTDEYMGQSSLDWWPTAEGCNMYQVLAWHSSSLPYQAERTHHALQHVGAYDFDEEVGLDKQMETWFWVFKNAWLEQPWKPTS